jgi:hypothetical protein
MTVVSVNEGFPIFWERQRHPPLKVEIQFLIKTALKKIVDTA